MLADGKWLSVGEYSNEPDAQLTSGQLQAAGIPSKVVYPSAAHPGLGSYYVRVPAQSVRQAQRILSDGVVSEDELTKLALASPPPDDF